MPTAKKKVTGSNKIDKDTAKKPVTKNVTPVTKQEKPPRGYEYRTFLVKKEEKKDAKVDRAKNRKRV